MVENEEVHGNAGEREEVIKGALKIALKNHEHQVVNN